LLAYIVFASAFVASEVALLVYCDMPGLRSAHALAARRKRAADRGFLQPCPAGAAFIAVEQNVRKRAKVVVRALESHSSLNDVVGRPFHFAAQAAFAAKPFIGKEAADRALALNRAAARARHEWADAFDSQGASPRESDAARANERVPPPPLSGRCECACQAACSSAEATTQTGSDTGLVDLAAMGELLERVAMAVFERSEGMVMRAVERAVGLSAGAARQAAEELQERVAGVEKSVGALEGNMEEFKCNVAEMREQVKSAEQASGGEQVLEDSIMHFDKLARVIEEPVVIDTTMPRCDHSAPGSRVEGHDSGDEFVADDCCGNHKEDE